jgi:ribonuclease HI
VREDSGAFALTTSSMTMEIMAVTRTIEWLETQTFHHVCFLSDAMSMLRKIKTGFIRREWLETIERSNLTAVCFIFVPGHAGGKGNERTDRLEDMAVEKGSYGHS